MTGEPAAAATTLSTPAAASGAPGALTAPGARLALGTAATLPETLSGTTAAFTVSVDSIERGTDAELTDLADLRGRLRISGQDAAAAIAALPHPCVLLFEHCDAHDVLGGERVGLDLTRLLAARHPAAGTSSMPERCRGWGGPAAQRPGRAGEAGLLHPATLRAMRITRTLGLPAPAPEAKRREIGLAWHVRETSTGLLERRVLGHAGWSGTQWWIVLDLDLVVVLLTKVLDLPGLGVDVDRLLNAAVTGVR